MSGMMRLGGTIFNIDKAFEGVGGCNSFTMSRAKGNQLSKGNNCGNAILFEIKKFLNEIENSEPTIVKQTASPKKANSHSKESNKCPECGEPIDHEGGCTICRACGYSHCV